LIFHWNNLRKKWPKTAIPESPPEFGQKEPEPVLSSALHDESKKLETASTSLLAQRKSNIFAIFCQFSGRIGLEHSGAQRHALLVIHFRRLWEWLRREA
jgi:hypothetical protein